MTGTLLIGAGIFAALALFGLAFIVLDTWSEGNIRKFYRDAEVDYDEPLPPEWVNDWGHGVTPTQGPDHELQPAEPTLHLLECPTRRRRGDWRDRCRT